YAGRWPALRDVPWYPCAADGVTGNLGSGCSTPEDVAVQVGTSSAMRAVVPGTPPTVPEGLWCYRVDRENALLGGAVSEGGNVPGWTSMLADVLGTPVTELAEPEASSRGTALLALKALGLLDPASTGARLGQVHTPDMQRHSVYRRAMARQREMEECVKRKT